MTKKIYKILLLLDLNGATNKILKNKVGLATMFGNNIEVLYVKKPSDIVNVDNQLSAMRSINTEHTAVEKKIGKLIAPISKEYGNTITHCFVFGNVKNEIGKYIEEHEPDIIVLGKRKFRALNLLGDGITTFVLNTFDGPILIAAEENTLGQGEKLSLGVINDWEKFNGMDFAQDVMEQVRKPVKSFKFAVNTQDTKEKTIAQDNGVIEYIFEQNDDTLNSLPKYLAKNNVNFVFVDRGNKSEGDTMKLSMSDIKNIIGKVKTSLLISPK